MLRPFNHRVLSTWLTDSCSLEHNLNKAYSGELHMHSDELHALVAMSAVSVVMGRLSAFISQSHDQSVAIPLLVT